MRNTVALAALLLTNCGPVGPLASNAADDFGTVYLYLINAYPGATEMKVKTSNGAIKGVAFGERVGEEGLCPPFGDEGTPCVPKLADRTDGVFETSFGGERGTVDLGDEIRAMYPQETGTVVFTGPDRGILLRHPQTISSGCGLDIVNALAVEDHGSEPARFDLAVEFERTPEEAGFLDETTLSFTGPCGPLPTDTPEHRQLVAGRTEALAGVAQSPWFVPVACENGEPGTCFAWGIPSTDGRAELGADGAVEVLRNTRSFYACVERALSRTDACGETPTWADVTFDARDIKDCTAPVAATTPVLSPQSVARFEGEDLCEATFRTRTPGRDLVFGPRGGDVDGGHGNGDLVRSTIDAPQGSDQFWVLYGRPVNPRVWQWNSSHTFVDLETYPYPGE